MVRIVHQGLSWLGVGGGDALITPLLIRSGIFIFPRERLVSDGWSLKQWQWLAM